MRINVEVENGFRQTIALPTELHRIATTGRIELPTHSVRIIHVFDSHFKNIADKFASPLESPKELPLVFGIKNPSSGKALGAEDNLTGIDPQNTARTKIELRVDVGLEPNIQITLAL